MGKEVYAYRMAENQKARLCSAIDREASRFLVVLQRNTQTWKLCESVLNCSCIFCCLLLLSSSPTCDLQFFSYHTFAENRLLLCRLYGPFISFNLPLKHSAIEKKNCEISSPTITGLCIIFCKWDSEFFILNVLSRGGTWCCVHSSIFQSQVIQTARAGVLTNLQGKDSKWQCRVE